VPAFLLSYFNEDRRFRRDNVERLLGPYVPDWKVILPRLLDYAVQKGFLHRSGRTVHEQVLFRLQSRRLPVRVHDLAADGSERARGGVELAQEIAAAAGALRALGVRPGDRVALVGLNSSRYLALDTAVGLTGAVSVPMYYTSPPAEIEGSCELGAPSCSVGRRTSERIGMRTSPTPPSRPLPGAGQAVVPAEAFWRWPGGRQPPAATIRGTPGRAAAPVGFDDPATLRFTSGTTGTPKGTTFRHGQVLWLAETLAALLPWRVRVRPARYLSFLPMNHVVEGILGTYAPYFLPAPVDVWFLEDFYSLSRALPRVRPTVFFSVPRFYEKVWERFAEQAAGRLYLGLPSGGLRRALRPLVRRAVLRRAGLDRCAQLLSARPVPRPPCGLPRGWRGDPQRLRPDRGPLVTLEPLRRQPARTVAPTLPRCASRRTGGAGARPQGGRRRRDLPAGWLATGVWELSLTGPGHPGRKKEILVTSYGKNIHPAKIEALLRQIPCLAEVMLVGESRPALCALLWLKGGSATPGALQEVDHAVRQVNERLSHPEQVKRWAVLAESPSIQSGELTGNLKLRRQAVLARRNGVVELLYAAAEPAGGRIPEVLHLGASRWPAQPPPGRRQVYMPRGAAAIEDLFARTAAAFGSPVPPPQGRGTASRLAEYARFTRERADEALERGAGGGPESLVELERRLHRAARGLGGRLRLLLGVRRAGEALAAARVIYRGLGIDFRYSPDGRIVIRRCSIASIYNPRVCALVSALDSGLLAACRAAGSCCSLSASLKGLAAAGLPSRETGFGPRGRGRSWWAAGPAGPPRRGSCRGPTR
jgi:long-chain acyl-CoA synthetase